MEQKDEKQQISQIDVDEKHLELLNKGFIYSTEQFDKAILYVSSGTLAVTFTFLEKFINLGAAGFKYLLLTCWFFEAVTILLFTINHYLSKKAFNNELQQFYYRRKKENDGYVKKINVAMIVTLILGLLSFILFLFFNITFNG
jgi:hypothetical protein